MPCCATIPATGSLPTEPAATRLSWAVISPNGKSMCANRDLGERAPDRAVRRTRTSDHL